MFSIGLAVTAAAALTLRPVQAGAQPRGHGGYHGGTHVSVGIGFGYGHPFYGAPYFYNPYWWGFYGGFYGGFWGYPSFAYGPYPYYGYPGYAYYDPSADLRLQVTPRTAEVYVDGYLIGTVDDFDGVFQRVHMPLGEHEITIYAAGYRSIGQRMLLRPFQSYKMKDTMQPLPPGTADEPRPVPAPRPARQEAQPPGAPAMEGPPPGYGNRLQVEPGNRLHAESGDRFGTVAVRVQPADAEVLIDGERWEATAGERVLVQLSAGQHRVEVRKAGYKPYSTTVDIRSGQTFTVNVSLSSQ